MISKSIRLFVLIFLTLSSVALFAQEDFSAEIVTHQPGDQEKTPAKIYVTKGKMRVESAGRNGHSGAVLMDFASQSTNILMPEQSMYMEFPAGKGPGAQRFASFFRPSDVENACGDWQKMATARGGECQKVGNETVNGRDTVKYAAKSANGDASTIWVDPKIAFPVKWEGKNGGGELQNIQVGTQSSSLFEIPAGYRKMELPAGMAMPGNIPPH